MPLEKSVNFLTKLFRRETSSNEFIPALDGLRCLALGMVVFYHAGEYLAAKTQGFVFAAGSVLGEHPPRAFIYGPQGLQMFFVMSGFILAIPFMRYHLGLSDRKVSLKAYFLRRLTRIEPPYIVSLIILFLLTAFVAGSKYSLGELTQSFFYSFFYIHNFMTPGDFPYINGVMWSLEIEVQFYVLAPPVIWLICQAKNKHLRRALTLVLTIGAAVLSWSLDEVLHLKVITLATYLQYFLAGILLADYYLIDWPERKDVTESSAVGKYLIFLVGLALFIGVVYFPHVASPSILVRIVSPLLIMAFYVVVFRHRWWNKIFSLNFLTLIGGMCYSIYLFHYHIISAVGRISLRWFYVENYDLFYVIQMAIFWAAILVGSAGYFLIVEKPCMARDWHVKMFRRIKSVFGKNGSEVLAENKN